MILISEPEMNESTIIAIDEVFRAHIRVIFISLGYIDSCLPEFENYYNFIAATTDRKRITESMTW